MRVHIQHLAELGDGEVKITLQVVQEAEVDAEQDGERVERERVLHLRDGFVQTPGGPQEEERVHVAGNGRRAVEVDGADQFAFGTFPIPVVEGQNRPQSRMGFGDGVVQIQSLPDSGFGFRHHFAGRGETEEALRKPGRCQPIVGEGIGRIEPNGFFE